MRNRILLPLLLLCCLAASCGKPAERLGFIYTPAHPADTFVFRYTMLLDEPQGQYSSRIACRYNANGITSTCIPVLVAVTSPSGERSMERIELPLASDGESIKVQRSGGAVMDMDWPYRDRIVPGEDTGLWHVAIRPLERKMLRSIYGMGFSYQRKVN